MPEVFEHGGKRLTLIDLSDCLENATAAFEPNPHTIEYLTPEQIRLNGLDNCSISSYSKSPNSITQ